MAGWRAGGPARRRLRGGSGDSPLASSIGNDKANHHNDDNNDKNKNENEIDNTNNPIINTNYVRDG